MGKWVHRLSDLDTELRTATCAECGPDIRVVHRGSWRCRQAYRQGDKNRRQRQAQWLASKDGAARLDADGFWLTKAGVPRHIRETIAESQGGQCAICENDLGDQSSLDHCHETGRVRGVLCTGCNVALGHLQDDPDLVMKAAEYLRFYS